MEANYFFLLPPTVKHNRVTDIQALSEPASAANPGHYQQPLRLCFPAGPEAEQSRASLEIKADKADPACCCLCALTFSVADDVRV